MIHEFKNPMPCVTPLGDGYAIYVRDNGMFENDEWTVVLIADGQVRHFHTGDIKMWASGTYGIKKGEKP